VKAAAVELPRGVRIDCIRSHGDFDLRRFLRRTQVTESRATADDGRRSRFEILVLGTFCQHLEC
jgi:hypothetical protein